MRLAKRGRRGLARLALGTGLALAGLAAWWDIRRPASLAPALPATQSFPVATEADILADRPDRLTPFRFARNPKILVLDFPDLRAQGLALNRIAAFAEKVGEPHDRVLDDAALDRAIRAGGSTVETYYYGHDYAAATLRQFFALADRDHVPLGPEEQTLRQLARGQGMLDEASDQALVTLPREGADALVDAMFRRTILRHELSHGEYFTVPAYADYSRRFWEHGLDDTSRAAFRQFLAAQEYDPALGDLTINETQAFLMHTRDDRAFSAAALGLAPAVLAALQARFLLGMPTGWLRDCTSVPSVAPPVGQ